MVNRIFHKSRNHQEAEAWDIQQYHRMSLEERQAVAYELKIRAYGENVLDVRESHRRK